MNLIGVVVSQGKGADIVSPRSDKKEKEPADLQDQKMNAHAGDTSSFKDTKNSEPSHNQQSHSDA